MFKIGLNILIVIKNFIEYTFSASMHRWLLSFFGFFCIFFLGGGRCPWPIDVYTDMCFIEKTANLQLILLTLCLWFYPYDGPRLATLYI